jgi:hypothetical protein
MNNWQTAVKKTMSPENAALCYTLGALFTVVALTSFIELLHSSKVIISTRSIRTNHIYVIAIYAFTQSMLIASFSLLLDSNIFPVRMVYFFLIPNSSFESSATDYVLVVLPTFLYFTGFSTIIIAWYLSFLSFLFIPFLAFTFSFVTFSIFSY